MRSDFTLTEIQFLQHVKARRAYRDANNRDWVRYPWAVQATPCKKLIAKLSAYVVLGADGVYSLNEETAL